MSTIHLAEKCHVALQFILPHITEQCFICVICSNGIASFVVLPVSLRIMTLYVTLEKVNLYGFLDLVLLSCLLLSSSY
jgi:hypothetical protein